MHNNDYNMLMQYLHVHRRILIIRFLILYQKQMYCDNSLSLRVIASTSPSFNENISPIACSLQVAYKYKHSLAYVVGTEMWEKFLSPYRFRVIFTSVTSVSCNCIKMFDLQLFPRVHITYSLHLSV